MPIDPRNLRPSDLAKRGFLAVGNLPLDAGRQSLVIDAVRIAGGEVLELKHVRLRRVE